MERCPISLFPLSLSTAVQSLHTLNDQISHFIVTKSKALEEDDDLFVPTEKETLKSSMILMRHLLMDAQVKRLGAPTAIVVIVYYCEFIIAIMDKLFENGQRPDLLEVTFAINNHRTGTF